MSKIAEMLDTGKENATTGKELANIFNISMCRLRKEIEQERRSGQPICANYDLQNAGYYLAGDAEELQEYCRKLEHRANEMLETARALLEIGELLW